MPPGWQQSSSLRETFAQDSKTPVFLGAHSCCGLESSLSDFSISTFGVLFPVAAKLNHSSLTEEPCPLSHPLCRDWWHSAHRDSCMISTALLLSEGLPGDQDRNPSRLSLLLLEGGWRFVKMPIHRQEINLLSLYLKKGISRPSCLPASLPPSFLNAFSDMRRKVKGRRQRLSCVSSQASKTRLSLLFYVINTLNLSSG